MGCIDKVLCLGCVEVILMKFLNHMKRMVVNLDPTVRLNNFMKPWTSVIYYILASLEINSLGLGLTRMEVWFRRG